jgi:hypothetical protein
VEVLTAYSHTTQLADLRRWVSIRPSEVVPSLHSTPKRPWSLRDRLDECTRADLIAAYLGGTSAASLATMHELSPRSVKRLLAAVGVRRQRLA